MSSRLLRLAYVEFTEGFDAGDFSPRDGFPKNGIERDPDAAIGEDRPPDGVSDIPLRSGRVVLKGTETVGPSC
jgi:hypothetical protein